MSAYSVVIIGRPNVGKSSLLNRLAGRRVSIVEPTPGVTRDRVTVSIEHAERKFDVTDTGGLGLVDEIQLKEQVEAQIEAALERADVILFVVDGKEGFVPGDRPVADRLRRLQKPVLLIANKVESRWDELAVHEWERFGFGPAHPISAQEGLGIHEMLDRVVAALPPADPSQVEVEGDPVRFAVVGKRNSGKSTLINLLVGDERVIVSEIPGTTRDAVDVVFERGDQRYLAIDTAGIRKRSSIQDAIELFSYTRATDAIRRAQVVVHLFDIGEEISQVDKKVAAYCVEHCKPVLLVGNKLDKSPTVDLEHWDEYIRQQLPGLDFAPVTFISALEGRNVESMLDLLVDLRGQARTEIPTPRLNEVLQAAKTRLLPRSKGKLPKLFYGTQLGIEPVTLLIFVNEPSLFRGQYDRYLQNRLREEFDCQEVPMRLVFRRREKIVLGPT